jgi:hypothetical protein
MEKIVSLLICDDDDDDILINELNEMKRIGKELTSDDLDRILRK